MSYYDIDGQRYYSYDHLVCPVCGGKIIHPHTGCLTEEQSEENFKFCLWIECVDENNLHLGYHPICKKSWFKES